MPRASSIDIVNSFVTAIRETADVVADSSVGRNLTVAVMPLQVLADAVNGASLLYYERTDNKLLENRVSYARVLWPTKEAVMVPLSEAALTESNGPPLPGGLIGR